MRLITFILLPIYWASTAHAGLPGASYPSPRDISSSSSSVAAMWKNITDTLEQTLAGGGWDSISSYLLRNTTFSIGLFSLYDKNASSLQYHHISPSTINGTFGTTHIDSDTIYRVASVSKLITTYAGMVQLEDDEWNTPLTKIYPSLQDFIETTASDPDFVKNIQWDKVTVGDIAAHLGGIPRLGLPVASDIALLGTADPATLKIWGLPTPNITQFLEQYPCLESLQFGTDTVCGIQDYVQGIASNPPRYLPGNSPLYSDSGFFLLGGALSNLTGKSMDELYQDALFTPLGLKSTFSNPPTKPELLNRTVIASTLESDLINVPITTPSGGIYSTINDLATIGISILNSTLLPVDRTNRWLQPVSFTRDLHYALGRPWEIYRYVHPDTNVVTNIYTKLGDAGSYASLLALTPDFDFGFTILGASPLGVQTQAIQLIADQLTNTMIPSLMNQARREAFKNLAGTYTPKAKALNTSVTLTIPSSSKAPPGLVISKWVSNGTDVIDVLAKTLMHLVPHVPQLPANRNMVRIVPTIRDVTVSGQIAFQMETVTPVGPIVGNMFSEMYNVGSWVSTIDQLTYHDIPINEFVFSVDKTGNAFSLSLPAYEIELVRNK
ncbi:alkaline D-peptidase [Penicillium malachiteum]|uniref:Alkaline D-peptidase n=1 Tax=Penicillium malachiteum TaxID=1324776 RepID=A0AAD6N1D4_9EURO|nr:alkaline D-peptidase [Penicillium malachiteum]